MIAEEYLTPSQTCVFHDGPDPNIACGQPAVAVYVSDDDEPKGQYVCERHARIRRRNTAMGRCSGNGSRCRRETK